MDILTLGDSFLDSCIVLLQDLLKTASISELVVESYVRKDILNNGKHLPSFSEKFLSVAHPLTSNEYLDLFFDYDSKTALNAFSKTQHSALALEPEPPWNDVLLTATFLALVFDGGCQAALNVRVQLVTNGSIDVNSVSEFKLIEALLRLHPKAHSLWAYRRYLLRRCILSRPVMFREMALIQSEASRVSHNYFPWIHWIWLLEGIRNCDKRLFLDAKGSSDDESKNPILQFLQHTVGLCPFSFAPYHHFLAYLEDVPRTEELLDSLNQFSKTMISLYPQSEAAWLFDQLLELHFFNPSPLNKQLVRTRQMNALPFSFWTKAHTTFFNLVQATNNKAEV